MAEQPMTRPARNGAQILEQLSALRSRIIDELFVRGWKDVWFFPPSDGHGSVPQGIRGWEGTQDLFIVGLNPSTGQFPNRADQFFYQQLSENQLHDAHLTDVIKLRATGTAVKPILDDAAVMRRQAELFMEEIDVVKPRLIVPMGKAALEVVRKWLPNSTILRPIPHYSPRIWSTSNLDDFRIKLRAVVLEYRGCTASEPATAAGG